MTSFLGIVGFELRQSLRRISTWVYFAIFFWLAFTVMLAYGGVFPGFDPGSSRLLANSPSRITGWMAFFSLLMTPVTAAIAGNAVYRDFEAQIHPLFFTTPVRRPVYLAGRYLGAVLANLVVALSAPLGLVLASAMPGMDAARVGPFRSEAYGFALAWLTVPNLLFTGAVFFSLAALTRRMLPNYAGGILLLLAYALAMRMLRELDSGATAELLDAFGIAPLTEATQYWTIWERNHSLLPVTAGLLWNRLLWLAAGAAVLAGAYRLFRFSHLAREGGGRGDVPVPETAPVTVEHVPVSYGTGARLRQVAAVARRSWGEVVGNVYFPVMVGACLALLAGMSRSIGAAWGTSTWPVTYQVLEVVSAAFGFFTFIIVAFYAGELVWREREIRAAGVVDALPLPTWVPVAGKMAALAAVVVALYAVAMVAGMTVQAAHGYWRFEPGHYLAELFGIQLTSYLLMVVLAVLVHVVVNHKYVGHVVLVVYFAVSAVLAQVVHHRMVDFGSVPDVTYSDMNGYGHGLVAWGWFQLYWAAWALLFALLSNLLWVRGQETSPRWRLRLAGRRATGRVRATAALALLATAGLGGWIFYNTDVLNDHPTERETTRILVRYEKRYKRFENVPQPRVAAARLWVDIYPGTREARLRGIYRLVNRTGAAIDTLHIDIPSSLTVHRMAPAAAARPVIHDTAAGYYAWALREPLRPGASLEFRFDLAHETRGFTHETSYVPVAGNGTFFSDDLLPHVGYNPAGELAGGDEREKQGLPPRPRIARIGDRAAQGRNEVSRDADWMDFEATVSTSADQVAVAPGYLQNEWTRGGRRFFHYRMDSPSLGFYSFLSARYAVRRDAWRGPDGRVVRIEVFHHPGHEYNLDRMIRSVKRSLDYYTAAFGPYQHRQVRILEFPRYAAYAQSFANTIPYSEAIGFIARVGEATWTIPSS
jgi:ABC-type transport system involved in multi-copper enzyme maturation permease subunit